MCYVLNLKFPLLKRYGFLEILYQIHFIPIYFISLKARKMASLKGDILLTLTLVLKAAQLFQTEQSQYLSLNGELLKAGSEEVFNKCF